MDGSYQVIYSAQMSELQEFVKKRTAKYPGISCRKLYGLDAFYLSDRPFIIISSNERIVVKVEDFEAKKELKVHQITEWTLNSKVMENWFLLPETFNKKKNKLLPILEMASKVLLHPKKEKKKQSKKSKPKKCSDNIISEAQSSIKNVDKKPSLFKRLFMK